MVKSFVFKNVATVYANDIDEAKRFLYNTLKIDNNVEALRKKSEEIKKFSSIKYWDTYTEDDINSIYETDYDKVYTYINEEDLLEEDIPFIYDTKPKAIPKPLVSLPLSKAMKYESYKKKMESITIPSLSYWQF